MTTSSVAAGRGVDDEESADAASPAGASPLVEEGRARGAGDHPRPRARIRTGRRLALVFAVIAAAFGFVLYKGLTSAVVYFKTANEAIADRAELTGVDFQIEGVVVGGSVHQLSGGRVAFDIESQGVTVAVVNDGAPPQLFKPGIPVVLAGSFAGTTNVFDSDQILVKHSNEYVAQYPTRVTLPRTVPTLRGGTNAP
ncbi:MAG TPA: cytochrome c maturation protein CcmE [Acidimicrobiales bacterium]|nr:cytochrome c maturation protein CcmE [Acidimicrobiales bacterium]